MFNGIINNIIILLYNKYILRYKFFIYFIFIKVSDNFCFNLNLGSSFIINGLCLTLINKFVNFLEFELSYETIKISVILIKYLNIEKSLLMINNIDGQFLYGHINTKGILLIKYYCVGNFYKQWFLCNYKFKKYLIYKYIIFINGVSLTINEVSYLKHDILLIYVNLVNFSNNFTNNLYIRLFEFVNIEFDLTIIFILNFLFNQCI